MNWWWWVKFIREEFKGFKAVLEISPIENVKYFGP